MNTLKKLSRFLTKPLLSTLLALSLSANLWSCNMQSVKANVAPYCDQVIIVTNMLKTICDAINDSTTTQVQRSYLQGQLSQITADVLVLQKEIIRSTTKPKAQ